MDFKDLKELIIHFMLFLQNQFFETSNLPIASTMFFNRYQMFISMVHGKPQ